MASLIVQIKDRVVQTHPITKIETTLGRAAGNDVVIDNMSVSDFHAALRYDHPVFYVHDMHSTNGVFVGGHNVVQAPVQYGESFGIGKFTILLTPEGGAPTETLEQSAPANYGQPTGGQPHSTFFMKPVDVATLLEGGPRDASSAEEGSGSRLGLVVVVLLLLTVIAFVAFLVLLLTR